jgi:hypothetical protein
MICFIANLLYMVLIVRLDFDVTWLRFKQADIASSANTSIVSKSDHIKGRTPAFWML